MLILGLCTVLVLVEGIEWPSWHQNTTAIRYPSNFTLIERFRHKWDKGLLLCIYHVKMIGRSKKHAH